MPSDARDLATLVVFCRRPAPGIGKQRLAEVLGVSAAFTIGERLLGTALEDLAAWPGPRVIAPADPHDAGWARALPVPGLAVVPQPAGNLGVRLAGVDRLLRSEGYARLLYIGSDAPVLTLDDYQRARDALAAHDVVLAPAIDGGVTCMGGRRPWPRLDDLPWSEGTLHTALDERCRTAGLTVNTLPTRYDVDVPDDLRRLCSDLAPDKRPARQALYRTLCSLGYCVQ